MLEDTHWWNTSCLVPFCESMRALVVYRPLTLPATVDR